MKKSFKEFKEFIAYKKVAVVGIGVSNIPLIHFLVSLKAQVSAFDKKNEQELGTVAKDFREKGVSLILGDNYLDRLIGYDVIFKTPSMRIDSIPFVKAKQEGAYITSEMEEFVRYCPAKIYGVTGSDGKTTTTTLIYNMLKEEGYTTWVGGNIGTPLFSDIEKINTEDKVVLELSSFQLMTMTTSPDIAVITNLSPNHLDMHKDMNEYVNSKKNIFKFQNEKNILVLNRDNRITCEMEKEAKGKVKFFSIEKIEGQDAFFRDEKLYLNGIEVCRKEELIVKGMHNVENFLTAFCAVAEDVKLETMRNVARTFKGVEHRCELVRELEGVKYYNDSIASSPTRTLAGLKAFEKPVILIAGGYDKKLPFNKLAEEGVEYIKALILVGDTKYKIEEAFKKVLSERKLQLPIFIVETFEDAVYKAKEIATKEDIVTMSPACASFDMFNNFEVRGNRFKEIILNM